MICYGTGHPDQASIPTDKVAINVILAEEESCLQIVSFANVHYLKC